jgi:hypothetical protein
MELIVSRAIEMHTKHHQSIPLDQKSKAKKQELVSNYGTSAYLCGTENQSNGRCETYRGLDCSCQRKMTGPRP